METSDLDEDEPPSSPSASSRRAISQDEGFPGIEVENLQTLPVDIPGSIDLVGAVLTAEGYPPETQVTVVFIDDERMTDLNRRHLDGSGPTDVISVPLEHLTPGTVPVLGDDAPPLMLGDVFVSPATVERKVGEDGDFDEEMALMIVHAVYHLLGWDHADDVSADAMEERERRVLESLGRSRR